MLMEEHLIQKKRVRDDDSSDPTSNDYAAAKRIRDDLLVLLDEPDTTPPVPSVDESDIYELDYVMKSFEEELAGGPTFTSTTTTTSVPVLSDGSESGESHPELGFLLGASDDELGLPCSTTTVEEQVPNSELVRVMSESSSGIGEFWEFDDGGLSGYDSFGYGCVGVGLSGGEEEVGSDFVTLDGIFDYLDVNFGPLDYVNDNNNKNNNNNSWQQESLPAL